MRLLIYIEPTPYLLALWLQVKARSSCATRIVFLAENVSQSWNLDLSSAPDAQVLRGNWLVKWKVLKQLVDDRNVELVHLAGWGHPMLLAALVLAWFRRVPVTMETDTSLPQGLVLWKRSVKRLFYPLLFKLPAMFLPGGKRQAQYLLYYGVAEDRITMAMMTVDVATISRYVDGLANQKRVKLRSEFGLPDAATVFLYVGRMEPHKGVEELIEAFGRLQIEESASAILLLVGDGSMRAFVERAVIADPRIRFTGRLSGTVLLDAYAAADVFVLASRFEPWGLVVNEAMAAGLPVIATDCVGCVDDLVVEGETGCVVPAHSVDSLAAAMQSLNSDRTLCGKMARNSRVHIAGWTLENEAEIVVDTWKRLVKP